MRIFPQTVVFHGWKLALATGHSSTRTTSNKHSSLPACSVFRPKRTKFTAYCVFLVFEYCICVFVAVFVYVSILRDKRRSSSKTLFLTRRLNSDQNVHDLLRLFRVFSLNFCAFLHFYRIMDIGQGATNTVVCFQFEQSFAISETKRLGKNTESQEKNGKFKYIFGCVQHMSNEVYILSS